MALTQRWDNATIGAFERQLEHIEEEVQREQFSELAFAEGRVVPLDIKNMPGIRFSTYRKITAVGRFKLHRSYSTEIPMVNILSEEFTQQIHKWVGGYYLSDDDIEAALLQGMPLEQEDVQAVREAAMQQLNHLIAFGDPALQMPGFLNHPDVLHSFAPKPINSGATANEILALMNDGASAIVELTKQVEKPDTLQIPLAQWNYISTARLDNTLERTIFEQFAKTSPYIKNVEIVNECAGAGIDGTDIMVFYKRSPQKFKAMVFEDFRYAAMERRGLGFQRPAFFRYGGLRIYRPYSIHIVSGI
ncbi:MAG TPA: major capsid family protein [Allocoleopsis sp.]